MSSTHPASKIPELDTTVRPQDDFFGYVNKKWINTNPIPESETKWGTFTLLREESWKAMHDIYEDLQDKQTSDIDTVSQQARDFYYTGMHYDEFEQVHIMQLNDVLAQIDAVQNIPDLSRMIGTLHAMEIDGLWGSFVDADHHDNTKHVLTFHQSGLTLPDRDYYLVDNEKMQKIRDEYKKYAFKVYEYFPQLAESADTFWQSLIAFETDIANISRPGAALRDVEKNYNKTSYNDLKRSYSSIHWDLYATNLGWQPDDKISVGQPEFMKFIDNAIATKSLDTLKTYLKWHSISSYISKISTPFSALHFDFYGRVLSGTSAMMPQWKRVVLNEEVILGESTGRIYAERHFPESSKKAVRSIVESVREAYSERIDQLDWMSNDTKSYAKKKLRNMKVLVGYPDEWRDFSSLTITRDSYISNIMAGQKFNSAFWLKRLHEPTSRSEWYMTPQTVNAYHDPNRLVICFPAAILQSPFFSPDASLAANMGGIGSVIGHELTHGFDDQGCMFDATGNVRTWQTGDERKKFREKANVIVEQANKFDVLPGLKLQGQLVLGESIADLGGVELSLHALKTRLDTKDDTALAIQEFFINYAFTECGSTREEKLREMTITDPHPVSEFRVNGILANIDDFYQAYDITEADALYIPPDKRARIW